MILSPRNVNTDARLRWFKKARIGAFFHFGLYAIPAQGEHLLRSGPLGRPPDRGPQSPLWRKLLKHGRVSRIEYEKLARQFNPHRFQADAWIDAAELLGARYLIVTAKHLDGFCLFDSALTDYKITNTPFGRDLIGELAAACHRRRMRIIFYYSRADWHHRNYVFDPHNGSYSLPDPLPDQKPDWPRYREYFLGQLRELCTLYGRVDGFWFDAYGYHSPDDPSPREIYKMIKHYQPDAVINDRNEYGDYYTPERNLPEDLAGLPFEVCQALGDEWGYVENCALYTAPFLAGNLLHTAGHGGNLALNFGPRPDGAVPADRLALARQFGAWVRRNADAIYGAAPYPATRAAAATYYNSSLAWPIAATRRGRNLFLLLPEWPAQTSIRIPAVRLAPQTLSLAGYRGRLSARATPNGLEIHGLPTLPPQVEANVIRLTFRRIPAAPKVKKSAPPVVPIKPDGGVFLPPECAVRNGRRRKGQLIRIRTEVNGVVADQPAPWQTSRKVFVDWDNIGQKVSWRVGCAAAGPYEAFVELRCPAHLAGGVYTLQAGRQVLRATVKPTSTLQDNIRRPASHWAADCRLQRQRAGVLRLSRGISVITLKPALLVNRVYFAEISGVWLKRKRYGSKNKEVRAR